MIKTKEDLKRYLNTEKPLYVSSKKAYWKGVITKSESVYLWRLVRTIRIAEFCFNNRKENLLFAFLNIWYTRKSFSICRKLSIEISSPVFEEGLEIYHPVGIVINGDAKVGKNCKLHGANVIGNMGNDLSLPVIGNNVRLGVGAKVLGNVFIANNVQIGAGAVVVDSCYEEGALLIGIPARVHRKKENRDD